MMFVVHDIEVHDEVADWLGTLSEAAYERVARRIDELAAQGGRLRMPRSRALGDGLFELRISLGVEARRITYWFAPDKTVVLLTTFTKQRMNERREIARARNEIRRCTTEHRERGD